MRPAARGPACVRHAGHAEHVEHVGYAHEWRAGSVRARCVSAAPPRRRAAAPPRGPARPAGGTKTWDHHPRPTAAVAQTRVRQEGADRRHPVVPALGVQRLRPPSRALPSSPTIPADTAPAAPQAERHGTDDRVVGRMYDKDPDNPQPPPTDFTTRHTKPDSRFDHSTASPAVGAIRDPDPLSALQGCDGRMKRFAEHA
ncbi:hypothetical protein STRIP9103_01643 [Streptomyces ipomoeae 91-03]|uniref:Uncharacterized protein n=1 Tax=Streptomyces ipomoeae 91-03 TaxID=698759 RepID=L1KQU8_9ACTN|nr:hypothetical protein STRIP9103_01643 [Streptomyces ipomoeae 91-03]